MEGLTHHIMDKHPMEYNFLKTRAWEGNSHIGNRPIQATYYYDWARSLSFDGSKARHVCEIGMNGGHSALIFLAALTQNDHTKRDANVTMFDFFKYTYSPAALKYVETLYPGRFSIYKGDSHSTLPKWIAEKGTENLCDIFSVDGDHSFQGAKTDIQNAVIATRKGGKIILDDMSPVGQTRRAFEEALTANIIGAPRCVENVETVTGHIDRIDETNVRKVVLNWCTATVV